MIGIHYRVAFLDEGTTIFGIVETGTQRARKHAELNELVVLDAVLPKTWYVEERLVSDISLTSKEYENYINDQYQKALAISDQIEGCQVGKIMKFNVNNGFAYYVINGFVNTYDEKGKFYESFATMEWRGFGLDRWTEPVLGYFGKISKIRAEKLIKSEDAFRDMFSGEE